VGSSRGGSESGGELDDRDTDLSQFSDGVDLIHDMSRLRTSSFGSSVSDAGASGIPQLGAPTESLLGFDLDPAVIGLNGPGLTGVLSGASLVVRLVMCLFVSCLFRQVSQLV
jgi:hypothetical protein